MARKLADGLTLQIATDEARAALTRVNTVTERKTTMPVVGAVLIESRRKEEVSFGCYDMEIGLVSRHTAEVETKGRVVVPAALLKGVIDRAPENVVEITAMEHSRIRIVSGHMEAEIVGMPFEQMIEIPGIPESMRFAQTDSTAFLALIDGVGNAMSGDESRPNLCGAILERTRIGWRMVATDGSRMAALEHAIEESNRRAVDERVFLGSKTLETIRMILAEGEASPGELGFNKTTCVYRRDGLDIIARLQEDAFPGWQEVIPETVKHSVILPRTALLDAVARLTPIASEHGEKVVLHVGKNVFKLRAEDADLGYISDRLTCEHTGADVTLALNGKHLLDTLKALDGAEQVVVGMDDSLSPVTVRPVGNEKLSVWVQMPLRVETAEADAIKGENLEEVFTPFRDDFRKQNTKRDHVEQVTKLGRDAARGERRSLGRPLVSAEMAWPKAGFWQESESLLGREIPEEERAIARDTFWTEATKPWPVGEPTKPQLEEVEAIGRTAGVKILAFFKGNKLTVSDRRGRAWPEPPFIEGVQKDLRRKLTDTEVECMRDAYYDACAEEDTGEEPPKPVPPKLRSVKENES